MMKKYDYKACTNFVNQPEKDIKTFHTIIKLFQNHLPARNEIHHIIEKTIIFQFNIVSINHSLLSEIGNSYLFQSYIIMAGICQDLWETCSPSEHCPNLEEKKYKIK